MAAVRADVHAGVEKEAAAAWRLLARRWPY